MLTLVGMLWGCKLGNVLITTWACFSVFRVWLSLSLWKVFVASQNSKLISYRLHATSLITSYAIHVAVCLPQSSCDARRLTPLVSVVKPRIEGQFHKHLAVCLCLDFGCIFSDIIIMNQQIFTTILKLFWLRQKWWWRIPHMDALMTNYEWANGLQMSVASYIHYLMSI